MPHIHTGVGHTDSKSAQHFWLGKTCTFFVCSSWQGWTRVTYVIESRVRRSTNWATPSPPSGGACTVIASATSHCIAWPRFAHWRIPQNWSLWCRVACMSTRCAEGLRNTSFSFLPHPPPPSLPRQQAQAWHGPCWCWLNIQTCRTRRDRKWCRSCQEMSQSQPRWSSSWPTWPASSRKVCGEELTWPHTIKMLKTDMTANVQENKSKHTRR